MVGLRGFYDINQNVYSKEEGNVSISSPHKHDQITPLVAPPNVISPSYKRTE